LLIDKNGFELKGHEAIAEPFSAHFASTRRLGSTSAYSYKEYFPKSEDTSIFLAPFSFDELQ